MSKCTKINKEGKKNKLQSGRDEPNRRYPCDEGEEGESVVGTGELRGTGSAFRIRRKLQPQPFQCTSRLLLHASRPPSPPQQVSLGLRPNCTDVCRSVCVGDIGHFL